jgi:hypothetical protein
MKILVSIFFMLLSMAGISQVYQRQTAPFEFTRGIKQDTIAVIPRGCDTVAMPRIKWGAPSIGALYYDTCANTLYVKDSWGWMPVTGGLDSAAFAPVIDSTGQRSFRVLFAVNNKIYGSDKFTYDSLLNYLLITGKVEADSLIINGGAEFIGSTYIDDLEAYNLRVTNTAAVYDTANYKIGVINTSTGRVERFAYWPANGGGGGGTDTTSLSNRINLKLNISDTATMLAPYPRSLYRKTATDSVFARYASGDVFQFIDSIGGGGSGDYVPYEGATRKVRLTDYGLLTDFVDFDLTPVNADTTGRLNWDSAAGTLEVHLKGNNVHLQIGQEQVILVRNNTGSPLTDGQIVYITGSTGEVPTVALANNKTFSIASRTLGMVTEPIAHGQQGYITITGIVNGLNTNALTEGAAIWLDSLNGAYTQSQPASPYNDVLLGYVVKKSGGNGSIFVKAQNILDRNYTDSVVGLRLRIADTVGIRAKEVLSFAKNAARDSAILTLFDGTRFPVRDSVGVGFVSDSLAIRRRGTALQNIVSFNTTANGTAGTVGQDSATIAIGLNAARDITTAQGTIAIGNGAQLLRQTGTWNIAIGQRSLRANVNGNNNIAIGRQALETYTGNSNVAVGDGALTSATGSGNTGLGNQAGLVISSGANNSAVGSTALLELTTGSGNTGVGQGAGRTVTSGANNTSVGNLAGANGAAAKNSTVSVGAEAGRFTAESLSTWLGMDAGQGASGNLHTGGSYNLGLGYRTMFDVTGVRTGSSNTAIGDRINLPSRTSSNQFVYGSNGINWLTRFTDGGWLINYTASAVTTQTASAALEVNGTTGAVLFPRMTTAQRDALTATNGMVIYNTSTDKLQVRAAAAWVDLH